MDNNGRLDRNETRKFVKDIFGNIGQSEDFTDENYELVFSAFDKDNSGTVEKGEMYVFIKQLLADLGR